MKSLSVLRLMLLHVCCCPDKKGMLSWRMQSKLKSLQLLMFLSPFSPVKLWQLVIPSTWFSQCVTYRPETNFWNRVQKTKLTSQWTIHAQEKSLRVILIILTSKCCFVTIFKLQGHKSDFHYLLVSSTFFELYLPLMTYWIPYL